MEAEQRRAAQIVGQVLAGRSLADLLAGRAEWSAAQIDVPLVQELCYGSLRSWGRIDAIARQIFKKKPPQQELRCLIGVALYQLLETTAPEHTVVDQAVRAAARAGLTSAKGLVNAVLRQFLRQRDELLHRTERDEEAWYSHPRWWIGKLKEDHPQHWRTVLEANNTRPPMTLRVNRRRIDRETLLATLAAEGIEAAPVGDFGVILARPRPIGRLPGFTQGWFSVQDAGAQHAALLLGAKTGMRVLDACAAPGGKTTQLLEVADLDLVALDCESARLAKVDENLARLGLRAQLRLGDARRPGDWWDGRCYERILADVPCSSSGVVRRHPDIKYLRRESDLRELTKKQREILYALWPLLARGGRLVYATCSVFRVENAAVVEAFLADHGDARHIAFDLPEFEEGQLLPAAVDAAHNHDGFFYALLEKT